MKAARRKQIRLSGSEYEAGWYFVTVCTDKRRSILAEMKPIVVGADDSVRPCGASQGFEMSLTKIGTIVEECLQMLNNDAEGVCVDKYVIMPNHIHAIICLDGDKGGQGRPPLQRVMQRFKSITTRRCWDMGITTLWQRSYYDRVVRNEQDYSRIWQYIDENPARWAEDEYYLE